MVSKEMRKEMSSITELNHIKIKFDQSVHNGLSIWKDLNTLEIRDLKTKLPSESFTIMIITNGDGIVNINMEDVPVKKNCLVLLSPNTLVDSPVKDDGLTMSGVSFTIDFLSDIEMPKRNTEILDYFSPRYSPVWHIDAEDTSLIMHQILLLEERVENYTRHPYGKEILINVFNVFLFETGALGLKYSEITRLKFSTQENLVMRFGTLVRQQFRQERMVKNYADQLNVTSKYLTEVVKDYTGKNASDIINYHVILEAKFLLRKTVSSIAEIADLLHFTDQSFFGKYFKRHTQLSPKAFRENETSTV